MDEIKNNKNTYQPEEENWDEQSNQQTVLAAIEDATMRVIEGAIAAAATTTAATTDDAADKTVDVADQPTPSKRKK